MKKLEEQIKNLKGKSKFFNFILNGKNTAIIILSFLLFISIIAYPTDSTTQNLNNQVLSLNQQIKENNSELDKLQKQINDLQNVNQTLLDSNKKLEEEKQNLESEKNELSQKLEEAQKISSSTSNSTTQESLNSTSTLAVSSDSQGNTVYITKTGKKYHRSNCSYLKNSKISININTAKSKGYTACSKCNP